MNQLEKVGYGWFYVGVNISYKVVVGDNVEDFNVSSIRDEDLSGRSRSLCVVNTVYVMES